MTPDQANLLADHLVQDAREAREHAVARVARRRARFARFVAGSMALLGYFAGARIAASLTDVPWLEPASGVALGLLLAVLWSPRPQP